MKSNTIKCITIFCFIFMFSSLSNIFAAEKQVTRGQFLKQLTESMGLANKLGQTPKIEDYVTLLKKEGIKLPKDYDANKIITKEEKADLLSQALSVERKLGEKAEKAPEAYRDKAVIIKLIGTVSVKREKESNWISATMDMQLAQGDTIKTEKDSSALLRVGVVGRIEIKENSELLLKTVATQKDKKSEDILLYLATGEMLVDVRKLTGKSKFETHTPTTLAAVRGTTYIVKVEPAGKTEIREQTK